MEKMIIKKTGAALFAAAAILSAFTAASCKTERIEPYQNDPRLYFFRSNYSSQQQDSIQHSFFLTPPTQGSDTLMIEVLTMGMPENRDRHVRFVQTNAGKPGAAIPGVHYMAFDSPEMQPQMFVPAGKVEAKIPVILLRTEDMNNNKFRIEFEIAENDEFKPGIDKNLKFMIQTTAMAEKPAIWDSFWRYAFGKWGSVKMRFIIDYLGFSEFDERVDNAYRDYMKFKGHEKISEYNKTHGEYRLCEDVGKRHPDGEQCSECVVFP